MLNISMLSGGQDSTAMVFLEIEMGLPVDAVLFADTGAEFPEMYEYLDRVESRLKEHGLDLIRLKHKRGETFEDWCFGAITRGARKGMIRGVPMTTQPCYWKRESKVRPFEKYLKDHDISDYRVSIGYTYSEKARAQVKDQNQTFPLIELKKCEADAARKLEEIDLVNPLYENFERTGCFFCPYQKLRSFYLLWKLHPDRWGWMLDIETRLNNMENVLNPQWNIRYSMEELEASFIKGERLYEVEAPKACECKV